MIYEAEAECFKQKERPLQTPEAGMSLVYSRNRKLGSVAASKRARGRIGCDGVWVRDVGPSQEAPGSIWALLFCCPSPHPY